MRYLALLIMVLLVTACSSTSDIEPGLSYDAYIKAARQYIANNDIDRAISAYNKALNIRPDDAKTHYLLGELYQAEWDRSYRLALSKKINYTLNNPDIRNDDDSLNALARFGLKVGYDELAIAHFRETIKYEPDNWKARYYIATDLLNKKQYRDSIDEYNKIIKLNPTGCNVFGLIGRAYEEVGYYDLALKSYKRAYQITGDAEYYYFSLGRVYYRMDDTDKAVEMFKKLREMKSIYSDRLIDFKNEIGR